MRVAYRVSIIAPENELPLMPRLTHSTLAKPINDVESGELDARILDAFEKLLEVGSL